jgi:uncharacterized protein YggT (Ycf19 family)
MVDEDRVVTRSERVESAPPAGYVRPAGATYSESAVAYRTGGSTIARRAVIFIFGLIQGLLILRILLLLVAARQGNDIVSFIYSLSQIFVEPFRGILRINEVAAGQSALDVAAIVAIIGWTIIELIILGLLNIFRRTA